MTGESILVVDDEPVVLTIVTNILANAGYSVLSAGSPEEALELAQRHRGPIRLIVCDVVMPRMSGPEVAEAIEPLHPEAECLFIAGLPDSPEICDRILRRGRAFLPKPFVARTLLQKVDNVLGRAAIAAAR